MVRTFRNLLLIAGLFGASATIALAQSDAAGGAKGEIAFLGGGASLSDGGGSHGLVGATLGVRAGGRVRFSAEANYVPLGSETYSDSYQGVAIQATGQAKMWNFGGAVDVSIVRINRVAPYVVASFGASRQLATATATAKYQGQTITVTDDESSTAYYAGAGGGVRLYVGKKWGIRPEIRYVHYVDKEGNNGGSMFTYTAGLFFQFGQ